LKKGHDLKVAEKGFSGVHRLFVNSYFERTALALPQMGLPKVIEYQVGQLQQTHLKIG